MVLEGRALIFLYTVLGILLIGLPGMAAFWYAAKRGKSTRTTARFVLPYLAILASLFFWLEGLRGGTLLVAMAIVVAFATLAFYVYTQVADIGLGLRKK